MSAQTIKLAGMRFHTRVGILPHEQENPQPLEIDLSVRRREGARSILDYRDLYRTVQQQVSGTSLRYLEDAAGQIVDAIAAMDDVAWVRVALRKPHVALDGPLDYAEVAIERVVDG
jgi:7,8-dihydroneopterin aldolase/epimerase/oxygenase